MSSVSVCNMLTLLQLFVKIRFIHCATQQEDYLKHLGCSHCTIPTVLFAALNAHLYMYVSLSGKLGVKVYQILYYKLPHFGYFPTCLSNLPYKKLPTYGQVQRRTPLGRPSRRDADRWFSSPHPFIFGKGV